MNKSIKYYIGMLAGCNNPQLQLQITPLAWGLELSVSRNKPYQSRFAVYQIGLRVGPIAVAMWWGVPTKWYAGAKKEKHV